MFACSVGLAAGNVVWSDDKSFSAPESAYYDGATGLIYVSNVVGAGGKKDGKGWISKLTPGGKVISVKWVRGLNAPMGMRSHDGVLWVTDIDRVVTIDMKTGKITKRIDIGGAKFLNDIAIAPDGTVYISDTIGDKIYQIKGDMLSVFMSGKILESPNGLLYRNGRLYVAAWGKGRADDWSTKTPGRIYYIDPGTKKIHYVTKKPLGNLDGLEIDNDGNFIVSDWMAGKIYRVNRRGKAKLIRSGPKGFADIGYVPTTGLIIVPEMQENRVVAFD